MKLKKALKVKGFRNKWEKLFFNFQLTNVTINKFVRDCFRESSITYSQYMVLKILNDCEEPVNILYIKDRFIESDSDISRLVRRLVDLNLVSKTASPTDRRHSEISITVTGQEQFKDVQTRIHAIDEAFFNLNSKEVNQLNELLDKIRTV